MGEPIKLCCCEQYDLIDGDTLYISIEHPTGVHYNYIRDIHYCPVCGQKLKGEGENNL